jgi:hypothetical protein
MLLSSSAQHTFVLKHTNTSHKTYHQPVYSRSTAYTSPPNRQYIVTKQTTSHSKVGPVFTDLIANAIASVLLGQTTTMCTQRTIHWVGCGCSRRDEVFHLCQYATNLGRTYPCNLEYVPREERRDRICGLCLLELRWCVEKLVANLPHKVSSDKAAHRDGNGAVKGNGFSFWSSSSSDSGFE